MTIPKPETGNYPAYYDHYISLVKNEDVMKSLYDESIETIDLLTSLDEETLLYRYAQGKWSVKDVFQHIIDTERIFSYRALCIARGDKTSLPGYDEKNYTRSANADMRIIHDMVREFSLVRATTLELFKSFDEKVFVNKGTANNTEVSVSAIVYMIAGHEIHHRHVIEERYIGK